MPSPYSDILFWTAVAATAVAQIFILRSTARGMRGPAARGRAGLEWMWAMLPAVSLVVLFVWTWRTMHPAAPQVPTVNVTSVTGAPPTRS
jgi:heme/copper-type cytochrome/quinol oxidase subunit 2